VVEAVHLPLVLLGHLELGVMVVQVLHRQSQVQVSLGRVVVEVVCTGQRLRELVVQVAVVLGQIAALVLLERLTQALAVVGQ
jgi:hypothetical protein